MKANFRVDKNFRVDESTGYNSKEYILHTTIRDNGELEKKLKKIQGISAAFGDIIHDTYKVSFYIAELFDNKKIVEQVEAVTKRYMNIKDSDIILSAINDFKGGIKLIFPEPLKAFIYIGAGIATTTVILTALGNLFQMFGLS